MSDERPVCGKPVILDGQPTDFDRFAELAGKFGDLRLADPNVFVGLVSHSGQARLMTRT